MKRYIAMAAGALLAASSAAATTGTRAASEVDFTYAGPWKTAYSIGGPEVRVSKVALAVKIRQEDVANYRNNKITSVNITSGVNNPAEVTVFVTRDLEGERQVEQKARINTSNYTQTKVALDTPYEISATDTEIYIGYEFVIESEASWYETVDGVPATGSNFIQGYSKDGESPYNWIEKAGTYGSLCLGCTIAGDEMKSDNAAFDSAVFDPYVRIDTKGGYTMNLRNTGTSPITTVEFVTTVASQEPVTSVVTLTEPVAPSVTAPVKVADVVYSTEGIDKVTARVTKVNGTAIAEPIEAEGLTAVHGDGYDRNPVIEDATATWCVYCPAGIIMLDYINEKYAGRFIGVSGHHQDRLSVDEYEVFLNEFVTGYPTIIVNREEYYSPSFAMSATEIREAAEKYYNQYTSYPAYCNLSLKATTADEYKTVDVEAEAIFDLPTDRTHYLSFIVTENGVGPYDQKNIYAGRNDLDMAGWEKKADPAPDTYFDDVVRAYTGWPGIKNSLPESIRKGEAMKYTTSMSLEKCTGKSLCLVGYITDALTGEIVNAARTDITISNGVESVGESAIGIRGAAGHVEVTGTDDVTVYTLDGRKVANSGLQRGIYIVRAGGETRKVTVK